MRTTLLIAMTMALVAAGASPAWALFGACCFPDGSCQDLTEAECTAGGGTIEEDGSSCDWWECYPPAGACCYADDTCMFTYEPVCAMEGGTFMGISSLCEPNPCGEAACCAADGSCTMAWEADCTAAGETWQGPGTTCTPNRCPQPTGACCAADGDCTEVAEADCIGAGGTYQGDGTICAPNPCPQPGACCVGTDCQMVLETECPTLGGTWDGSASCDPDPCASPGPTLDYAESCADHAAAGEICLDLMTNNVDPRLCAVSRLRVHLTDAVSNLDVAIVCVDNGPYIGTATVTVNGATADVDLTPALPDKDCCTVTLSGDATGSFAIRALKGDGDGNGETLGADMLAIKPFIGAALSAAAAGYDVDCSGVILASDLLAVKPYVGNIAPSCP